jgi:hypothetical protein
MVAEKRATLWLFACAEIALSPCESQEPQDLRRPPPLVLQHVGDEGSKFDIKVELKQFIC